jgi:hypothetical protein
MQEGYAVGWFTLSLINAGLAQAKGRSGLAWWLLSIVLGPIATLIIVIFPPVTEGGSEDSVAVTRMAVVVGIVLLLLIAGLLFWRGGAT